MGAVTVRVAAALLVVVGVAAIVWVFVRGTEEPQSFVEVLAEHRADSGGGSRAASTDQTGTETADGSGTGSADGSGADIDDGVADPIPMLGHADTLTGLDGWLNTDATSLEQIRARNDLTIVWFWTFGCYNCKNTIDALSQIYEDFGDRGVEIVGVHAPEFSYEAEVDNIVAAAADLGVTWPIALDTRKRNFHRWQEGPTAYWPRVYLIDGDNQIRLDKRGDGPANYALLYEYVERLLADEA